MLFSKFISVYMKFSVEGYSGYLVKYYPYKIYLFRIYMIFILGIYVKLAIYILLI